MTEEITITSSRKDHQGCPVYCVEVRNFEEFGDKILIWEFESMKEANEFAVKYASGNYNEG